MRPDRIEPITRRLATIGGVGLVAVIAQSVPHIPVGWRIPVGLAFAGLMMLDFAVGIWIDLAPGDDRKGGDDAS